MLALVALALASCASSTGLGDATAPVGEPCAGSGTATFTAGPYASGPSYGTFFTGGMQVVLGEDAMRFSDCGGLATSGPRFFAPDQLGDYVIDDADVRFSIGSASGAGATGTISITGYDPGTGGLCGSVDAITADGDVVRGTFSAQMRCP